MMSELLFKCRCGVKFKEIEYINHYASCQGKAQCPNIDCGQSLGKKEMNQHLIECKHKMYTCQKCSFNGNRKQSENHTCFKNHLLSSHSLFIKPNHNPDEHYVEESQSERFTFQAQITEKEKREKSPLA